MVVSLNRRTPKCYSLYERHHQKKKVWESPILSVLESVSSSLALSDSRDSVWINKLRVQRVGFRAEFFCQLWMVLDSLYNGYSLNRPQDDICHSSGTNNSSV